MKSVFSFLMFALTTLYADEFTHCNNTISDMAEGKIPFKITKNKIEVDYSIVSSFSEVDLLTSIEEKNSNRVLKIFYF